MVRVLVDTNILGGKKGRPLGSNDMQQLLDETRRGNLVLVVPEIVLRESANLWSELVIAKASIYKGARETLVEASLVEAEDAVRVERAKVRGGEEARLRQVLEEAGARVAALPALGQERVVERALRREQPFDKKGRDGYRDVILWETLLELAREDDPIVFVSNDQQAFFDNGDISKGLSGKLEAEFDSVAVRGASIEIHKELGQGIEAALRKAAEEEERMNRIAAQESANSRMLNRLNELIKKDINFSSQVGEAIEEALQHWDLGQDLREFGIADSDLYSAHIEVVESPGKLRFCSAYVAEDGVVLADLSAEVVVFAAVTMEPSAAMLLDQHPQVNIRDLGFESKVAEGQAELAARVLLEVVVDPNAPGLTSVATVTGFKPLTAGEFLSSAES